jgi:hypothetical protein
MTTAKKRMTFLFVYFLALEELMPRYLRISDVV